MKNKKMLLSFRFMYHTGLCIPNCFVGRRYLHKYHWRDMLCFCPRTVCTVFLNLHQSFMRLEIRAVKSLNCKIWVCFTDSHTKIYYSSNYTQQMGIKYNLNLIWVQRAAQTVTHSQCPIYVFIYLSSYLFIYLRDWRDSFSHSGSHWLWG